MRQAAVAVAVLATMVPAARAEVRLDVIAPTGTDAPQIRATVTGAPALPRSQYTLVDENGVTVSASSVVDFANGPDTVALAVVVQGSEVVMGNETFVSAEAADSLPGYWSGVANGLEAMDLGRRLPRGSQAMLVTYDDAASMRVPMGPAGRVGAAALGSQRSYHGKVGSDLVGGLATAVDALAVTRADLKVLLVIGDGSDTNHEAAVPVLARVKHRAVQQGIRVVSLLYQGSVPPSDRLVEYLTPGTYVATNETMTAGMSDVIAHLSRRTTVVFPGEHLTWDGRPHTFSVLVGKDAQEPVTIGTFDGVGPGEPAPWWHSWWNQVAIGLGAVALVMLLMRLRAGRSA